MTITADPDEIAAAKRVILPGVGAAGFAMRRIDELGLGETLRSLTHPVLGICVGMQILFDHSEEADVACLGIIPGAVRRLEPESGRPVPHMGWSKLDVPGDALGLETGEYVYFAHSFAAMPARTSSPPPTMAARSRPSSARPISPASSSTRSGRACGEPIAPSLRWPVMIILPAMDLMGGRPVRLAQGRFDDATDYLLDPAEAVLAFETAGAEWAHLVDLDGARAGGPRQHGMLADIALSVSLKLQVAGGFREEAHFTRMFDAGVDRVVIGSLAVKDPDRTRALFARFGGERLCLALDVKLVEGTPMVATSGWTGRRSSASGTPPACTRRRATCSSPISAATA
jgi:hypothetical protein